MMEKKQTSVYITEGLADLAHSRGINVSQAVDEMLTALVGMTDEEDELREKERGLVAELTAVRSQLAKYDAKIAAAARAKEELNLALKKHKVYYLRKTAGPDAWPTREAWLHKAADQFGLKVPDLVALLER